MDKRFKGFVEYVAKQQQSSNTTHEHQPAHHKYQFYAK